MVEERLCHRIPPWLNQLINSFSARRQGPDLPLQRNLFKENPKAFLAQPIDSVPWVHLGSPQGTVHAQSYFKNLCRVLDNKPSILAIMAEPQLMYRTTYNLRLRQKKKVPSVNRYSQCFSITAWILTCSGETQDWKSSGHSEPALWHPKSALNPSSVAQGKRRLTLASPNFHTVTCRQQTEHTVEWHNGGKCQQHSRQHDQRDCMREDRPTWMRLITVKKVNTRLSATHLRTHK